VCSEVLKDYVKRVQESLSKATNEVNAFCEENSWLNEIKAYITHWSSRLILEWKQVGAFEFDEQLSKIRNWSERIKINLEKLITSQNKILKVSTVPVEKFLLPKLDSIYTEICEGLVTHINLDTTSFMAEINQIIREIEERPKSIEDFARYAKKAFKYKSDISFYETKTNLVKSLIDVRPFASSLLRFFNDYFAHDSSAFRR
jgi:hypothetical protein